MILSNWTLQYSWGCHYLHPFSLSENNPDVRILEKLNQQIKQINIHLRFQQFSENWYAANPVCLLNNLISWLHYFENAGSILYISNKASLWILAMEGLIIFHNKQDVWSNWFFAVMNTRLPCRRCWWFCYFGNLKRFIFLNNFPRYVNMWKAVQKDCIINQPPGDEDLCPLLCHYGQYWV